MLGVIYNLYQQLSMDGLRSLDYPDLLKRHHVLSFSVLIFQLFSVGRLIHNEFMLRKPL